MRNGKHTFVVKSINPVNAGTLMIAPQQEEVFRVLDLVSQQKADGLQGLLPSINIIAQKQIIALRWETAIFEEAK